MLKSGKKLLKSSVPTKHGKICLRTVSEPALIGPAENVSSWNDRNTLLCYK